MRTPYLMQDSSVPTYGLLPGYRAVAGYIGGDTPHVWTAEEWGRFGRAPKLPIFVRSTPGDRAAGEADGLAALGQLYALRVPRGVAVAYDKETDISPRQVAGFRSVLEWAGFNVWLYGSAPGVFEMPALNYWPAEWTGAPHWPTRNSRACQFKSGTITDSSCVRWWQVKRGK